MARSLWKGNISFGLINIPVSIASAENTESKPGFNLIDKRDYGHIGYLKINKATGKPVENRYIVKGLKLDSGKYSIFDDQKLSSLHLKGNESIELQQFVDQDDVDPFFFEKPYFLLPEKGGAKTYVLLRDILKQTRKFGVGLLVMHAKQHLVLIGVSGPALTLEIIRYFEELKTIKDFEFPSEGRNGVRISRPEFDMAERLVNELTGKWNPAQYKDTFQQELMKAVKKSRKVDIPDAEDGSTRQRDDSESASKVLDLMPLLEKSLRSSSKKNSSKRKSSSR